MTAALPVIDRRGSMDLAGAAIMVGLTLSWGFTGVAAKIANVGYSPIMVVVGRSLIAAVLVWAWCRYRGISLSLGDGTLAPGLLAGALFAVEFVILFIGLDYTSAARGVLLLNTMPFWLVAGSYFLLGERISMGGLAGLLLAFSGVVVVLSDDLSAPGDMAVVGDVLSILAGGLWAATIVVVRRSRLATARPEKVLMYQLVVATLVSIPAVPLAGPALRDPDWLSTMAVLFQGTYITGFTFVVWFVMVARYPANALSSFAFLTPAFGVLLGAALLGEPLTWKMAVAMVLIAAGILIVNRKSKRNTETFDA